MTCAQQAGHRSSAQAWPLPHGDTCLRFLLGFAPPGIRLGTSPEPVSAWATFLSEGLAPTPTPHPSAHREGESFWGLQSPGSHPPAQGHRNLVADLGLLGLQGGVRAATHPPCPGWCAKTSLSPFQEGCSQLLGAGQGCGDPPQLPRGGLSTLHFTSVQVFLMCGAGGPSCWSLAMDSKA